MLSANLVLSGGGARGIAHLGIIKAMREYNLQIRAISGVSSGATVGAFIASGMAPEEALEVVFENSFFHYGASRLKLGLFSKKNMTKMLMEYLPENSFSALHIPLYVFATNMNLATTDCFSSGDLVKAIVASSAVPVLFSPVEINGYQYLDGGLLNNLPVEPFIDNKDAPVIGIHVNPAAEKFSLTSTARIIERSIELAVFRNIKARKRHCDLFLEPPDLRQFPTFEFTRAKELFSIGYDFGRKHLDKFLMNEKFSKTRSAA